MNEQIRDLEPKEIWNHFADLNAVPRPSKKEERVIEFMKAFGKNLGLETFEDEIRNVIIKKPATAGMEDRKTIVLQSHLDMVHQKNNDTNFDFETQGIEMMVDGAWVKAKGTTLGADNGIGVATIMSILASKNIPHPAIEALFTIDEETGMTGAIGLKGGILSGEILLNLDTEEEDEIDIGCAGGLDVTATRSYTEESVPDKKVAYQVSVKGLNGGHSGIEIHKGLGNANKIMNRILYDGYKKFGMRIAELSGGSLRNAIPRESVAIVIVAESSGEAFIEELEKVGSEIKFEFKTIDPKLTLEIQAVSLPKKVMNAEDQERTIKALYAAHNGVYRMSADIKDLVETSNNVARVIIKEGQISIQCLTRSSVETSKFDLADALRSTFELAGFDVAFTGSYPGWTPNVKSPVLELLKNLYIKIHNEEPKVVACHAGLECGILGTNYPDMDMISFGPTIRGAHSPDERVNIESVQRFWIFVKEILLNIPVR